MKKRWRYISSVMAAVLLLFPSQTVLACTGFIIGKGLTVDGSTLYGRTEDLEPEHNKNFVVHERTYNKAGAVLEDVTNGFTYALPEISYKYTAVPDVTKDQGEFDEAGFNEYGVSISATVSATANKKIQSVDPYVKNGIAESIMTTVVLPHVQSAREGVELLARIVSEQGAAEGNIVILADKTGVWYMEILSGHQYVAIKFPEDKFAVFPNAFFLGHVDMADKENVIASPDVEKVARQAKSYQEVDGKFHIAQSYNEEMSDSNRSRVWSGIKSLNPNAKINYDDDYFDLLQSSPQKLNLRDAMNLQRNRLEGTDYKPLDQMELDGKGIPESRADTDDTYKYPISNPNVMEAHIFQLKENLPTNVGGVMWLSVGSSRNAPYLPYYGNISNTYKAYQEVSTDYNTNSWYWTVSHINTMVAQYPDLFSNSVREEMERLEAQWMEEQSVADKEQIDLAASPEEASRKATSDSMERADKVFHRLKEIEKEVSDKIISAHGESALGPHEEEEIYLKPIDYKMSITLVVTVAVVVAIVVQLKNRSKVEGEAENENDKK